MRYPVIREHAGQYPVTLLCQTLQVARSGYYAWCRHPESRRAQEDRRLFTHITAIHTTSKATYGSPRVYQAVRAHGEPCGRHRVARVMRANDLVGKQRRRFRVSTTDSRH